MEVGEGLMGRRSGLFFVVTSPNPDKPRYYLGLLSELIY